MYVPLIGLAIVASWGGYDLLKRVSPAESGPVFSGSVLGGVAILALSVVARLQAGHWQDSYSLWTHTAEVTTNNFAAENGLATALYARGEFDAAIAHGTKAVRIEPDSVDGHINLALALLRAGQASEAVAHDRAAVRLNPGFALAHCNLGLALIRTGQPEEAIHELNETLRLDPSNREAMEGLEYMANRRKTEVGH
jgi:tetratricopeptide (TPR) repeat protein